MKRHTLLQYLYLFLVLLFTLNNSGCGCGNKALDEESDPELTGIELNKSQTKPLGAVNGRPVIEVEGKITKNLVGEDAEAFLLVIPKGLSPEQVKSIVASFRQEKKNATFEKKPGAAFPISTGSHKMLAYFLRDVGSKEEADIKATIPLTDLEPGDYELYLLLNYTNYGTAFSNIESFKELSIPASGGTQPAVTMQKAEANRLFIKQGKNEKGDDVAQKVMNRIRCIASITHKNSAHFLRNVWFLFIKKQQDKPLTATDILTKYIKDDTKTLPNNKQLTLIADNKAIIKGVSYDIPKAKAIQQAFLYDQDDTSQPFERGVTYSVYGVMMYEEDGIKKYVVSDPMDMTTPSASVKLTMEEIEITSLRQCQGATKISPELEGVDVRYKANISQNEGTTNNEMGLIFSVEKIDSPIKAREVIATLKKQTKGQNHDGTYSEYHKSVDGKQILYIIGNINNDTGDKEDTVKTNYIPFNLGEKYNVYCFVQDDAAGGGEVFLSNSSKILQTEKIELQDPNPYYYRKEGATINYEQKGNYEVINISDEDKKKQILTGWVHTLSKPVTHFANSRTFFDILHKRVQNLNDDTASDKSKKDKKLFYSELCSGLTHYYREASPYMFTDYTFLGEVPAQFYSMYFVTTGISTFWKVIDKSLYFFPKDTAKEGPTLLTIGGSDDYKYSEYPFAFYKKEADGTYSFIADPNLRAYDDEETTHFLENLLDQIYQGAPGDIVIQNRKENFKSNYATTDPRIQ